MPRGEIITLLLKVELEVARGLKFGTDPRRFKLLGGVFLGLKLDRPLLGLIGMEILGLKDELWFGLLLEGERGCKLCGEE